MKERSAVRSNVYRKVKLLPTRYALPVQELEAPLLGEAPPQESDFVASAENAVETTDLPPLDSPNLEETRKQAQEILSEARKKHDELIESARAEVSRLREEAIR